MAWFLTTVSLCLVETGISHFTKAFLWPMYRGNYHFRQSIKMPIIERAEPMCVMPQIRMDSHLRRTTRPSPEHSLPTPGPGPDITAHHTFVQQTRRKLCKNSRHPLLQCELHFLCMQLQFAAGCSPPLLHALRKLETCWVENTHHHWTPADCIYLEDLWKDEIVSCMNAIVVCSLCRGITSNDIHRESIRFMCRPLMARTHAMKKTETCTGPNRLSFSLIWTDAVVPERCLSRALFGQLSLLAEKSLDHQGALLPHT